MLSPAPTDVIIYRVFKLTINPLRDARWKFNEGKGRNETGHSYQAHLIRTHERQARILQAQLYNKNNTRIQSSKETNADLQPNKSLVTAHLVRFTY